MRRAGELKTLHCIECHPLRVESLFLTIVACAAVVPR